MDEIMRFGEEKGEKKWGEEEEVEKEKEKHQMDDE